MTSLQSVIAEVAREYPDVSNREITQIILDQIEQMLPSIIAGLNLHKAREMIERDITLERRGARSRLKRLSERIDFIVSLETVQRDLRGNGPSGQTARPTLIADAPMAEQSTIPLNKEPVGFVEMLDASASPIGVAEPLQLDTQVRGTVHNLDSTTCPEELLPDMSTKLQMKVVQLARKHYGRNLKDVEIEYDPYYGQVIVVRTDLPAHRALDLWRTIIDHIPQQDRTIPILVDWTGEMDVPDHELAERLAQLLIDLGVSLRAAETFDAVKAVEEGRD